MCNKKSNESPLYWNKHFYKNPFSFRINADFGDNFEIDNANTVNKTTNTYKQNPVCNG